MKSVNRSREPQRGTAPVTTHLSAPRLPPSRKPNPSPGRASLHPPPGPIPEQLPPSPEWVGGRRPDAPPAPRTTPSPFPPPSRPRPTPTASCPTLPFSYGPAPAPGLGPPLGAPGPEDQAWGPLPAFPPYLGRAVPTWGAPDSDQVTPQSGLPAPGIARDLRSPVGPFSGC